MQPVLANTGMSSNPIECDSAIVELRDAVIPYNVVVSTATIVRTDGANLVFTNLLRR